MGHDVAGDGGEFEDEEVARGGGAVGCAARWADYDLEGTGVDVGAQCLWGEVEAAGPSVSNRGIRMWVDCGWGGATACSGRDNAFFWND